MPSAYLPVLIFLMVATAFGIGALLIGEIFRLKRPYSDKLMPYESGNPPVGEPRYRFSVKFYIIAMLFVVFDVEAIFLYPWAVIYRRADLGWFLFGEVAVFVGLLVLGLWYAWKKGALEWD